MFVFTSLELLVENILSCGEVLLQSVGVDLRQWVVFPP